VLTRGELVAEGTTDELIARAGATNLARAFLELVACNR
jgi:ABC-type Na+ transport system ATPase subunit NatA